jgi:hypothetical protein
MKNKEFTVIIERRGSTKEVTDTLEGHIGYFGYTLECGQSWENERGNSKININPKTAKSLVSNLNKAKSNSAANGNPDTYYKLKE